VIVLFDKNRPERDPRTQRRTSCFFTQILDVDFFDGRPRHHTRQTHPAVVLAQSAAKGQKELFHAYLISIFSVIHPTAPPKSCVFSETARFSPPLFYHIFRTLGLPFT